MGSPSPKLSTAIIDPTQSGGLEDLRWEQNDWRFVADQEADYYDTKQLESEILTLMEERGIPLPRITRTRRQPRFHRPIAAHGSCYKFPEARNVAPRPREGTSCHACSHRSPC